MNFWKLKTLYTQKQIYKTLKPVIYINALRCQNMASMRTLNNVAYIHTYLLTYLLHGEESFLRS